MTGPDPDPTGASPERHAPVRGVAGAPASQEDDPPPTPTPTPRRTHPITPLVTGWKVVVGILAIVTAQNVARLVEDFTPQRALLALAVVGGVIVLSIGVSALSWWRTTYELAPEGVTLRSGLLTRTRRTAPRERIESVSIQRPALARLLGLAKVRVEIAGGSDSHLDIAYVRGGDAERLRDEILDVAEDAPKGALAQAARTAAPALAEDGTVRASPHGPVPTPGEEGPSQDDAGARPPGTLRSFLMDGVTDGLLIAQVPTERLLRSLVRDIGFVLSILLGIGWAIGSIVLGFSENGIGWSALFVLLPVILAVPRMVLNRIESGWGFVSRLTPKGLRMRRGLFSTRADTIGPGRVQKVTVRQPWLWRGPGWTSVTATVAGIGEETAENGASRVLPVGTAEELDRTLRCLLAPLGTDDDAGTVQRLLGARARDLDGLRAPHRFLWIQRRTVVVVELPGAVVQRSGILAHKLEIVPRERLQGIAVADDPFSRRFAVADLELAVAGAQVRLEALPVDEAYRLGAVLVADAAAGRPYRDKAAWPRPMLVAPSGGGLEAQASPLDPEAQARSLDTVAQASPPDPERSPARTTGPIDGTRSEP